MLRVLTIILSLSLVIACTVTGSNKVNRTLELESPDTVVYLVRHAEKRNVKIKDPMLTEQGKKRAESLAIELADVKLDKIYSTSYLRTQMTAKPTAENKKLEITPYSMPVSMLAAKILKLHKQQKVLVVGHSNTTPELIAALGIETPVDIEHDQYGDLFIIEFHNGKPQLTRSRFGN